MPRRHLARLVPALVLAGVVAGCDLFTDAATRLAYDLESASTRLGSAPGSRYTLVHRTPSKSGECEGPYVVQVDRVGAIIVWCKDASGTTVSSHSTTYHGRFTDTPATVIVEKPAREPLTIDLERRNGRAAIVAVR